MTSHFLCRISFLTAFFVTLPLLALGAPVLSSTLKTINSVKNMSILEPGTLLLLTLGGGGMIYLNRPNQKVNQEETQADQTKG